MEYCQAGNFLQLISIANFFKLTLPSRDTQIPESIRLATFEEIAANIDESTFETQLVKDMLCFLLHSLTELPPTRRI